MNDIDVQFGRTVRARRAARTVGLFATIAAGVAFAATPACVHAQAKRTVDGRVVRPMPAPAKPANGTSGAKSAASDSAILADVPGVMVTLHRVNKGGQGAPLDSMRSNASGEYHFAYVAADTIDAIYFTSTTYGGIAYFTAPMRGTATSGRDAEITVFDTTSRVLPLTVSGRHLIVSAADTATDERTVVEVFEISNDSLLTAVSGGSGKTALPTWSVSVPNDARQFQPGQGGDISPSAITFEKGRVAVFAPIAPGVKQVSFTYKLPVRAFPLPVTIEHGASVLEVLLEEPLGTATGAKLAATEPVTVEGRTFRRFVAQSVNDGDAVQLVLPSGPSVGPNLYRFAIVLTVAIVLLLVVFRVLQRRKRTVAYAVPTPYRAPEVPMADRLAREIADLDATWAKQAAPTDSLRAAYESRRAELKDALAAELARQ